MPAKPLIPGSNPGRRMPDFLYFNMPHPIFQGDALGIGDVGSALAGR